MMTMKKERKEHDLSLKNVSLKTVSYLLVFSAILRGYTEYEVNYFLVSLISAVYVISLVFERFFAEHISYLGPVYILLHAAITTIAFIIEPFADFWLILLIPTCIFAMRYYQPKAGYFWIAGFSVLVVFNLFIAHEPKFAVTYSLVYISAFILVSAYTRTLRDAEEAKEESRGLYRSLREAHTRLKASAENAEELAIYRERGRLARELHDSVTQTLFSMTLVTGSIGILYNKDPQQIPGKLDDLRKLAQSALDEMRGLVEQLRVESAEEDWRTVLSRHIEETSHRSGIQISFDDESQITLPAGVGKEVYRIVQEALNNVEKHSKALSAAVKIECPDNELFISVVDHGLGFQMLPIKSVPGHFGLETMKERAAEFGGTFTVESKPGSGTEVLVSIPLQTMEDSNV